MFTQKQVQPCHSWGKCAAGNYSSLPDYVRPYAGSWIISSEQIVHLGQTIVNSNRQHLSEVSSNDALSHHLPLEVGQGSNPGAFA